ncbi:Diaminopimelate epimerase-like protein [Aspergillus crustosus]
MAMTLTVPISTLAIQVVLDVFTRTRFLGNPLAIVRLPASQKTALPQESKQKIAFELNLSETMFLHKAAEDAIAPASFTVNTGLSVQPLRWQCLEIIVAKAGPISVSLDAESGLVSARISFDYHENQWRVASPVAGTETAPVVSIVKGLAFVLAELRDLVTLGGVTEGLIQDCVDPQSLDQGWNGGLLGTKYYVDLGPDKQGVRQPRTRIASSALSCYLALKGRKELGAGPFKYHTVQGVELRRRNDIYVTVTRSEDGGSIEKILLQGEAVLVSEGKIFV